MIVDIALGDPACLRIGFGDHDVAQRADHRPAREFCLRRCWPAAFRQRFPVGINVDLGIAGRAIGHEMHAVRAGPGGAGRVRRTVPERRHRLLQGPQRHRHIRIAVMPARIAECVIAKRRSDAGEGVDEDVTRIRMRHFVKAKLERGHAAADPHFEPSVA